MVTEDKNDEEKEKQEEEEDVKEGTKVEDGNQDEGEEVKVVKEQENKSG